jgi:hypothetical protein
MVVQVNDVDELRKFGEWVLGIGDGVVGDICDDGINVCVPDDLLIRSSGDHVESIVECIYPSILHNMNDPEFFRDRAILTPKNVIVDEIKQLCYVFDTW